MLANRSALLAIAIMICGIPTAMAQTSPPTPPGTNVGVLTCRLGPSIGLILGSRQRMACRFVPSGPFPPEMYAGVMGSIGLDLGITAGGAMAWGVFAPWRDRCAEDLPAPMPASAVRSASALVSV